MRKIFLRWVIRPPTIAKRDRDVNIDEDDLWMKILLRLKDMGLVKEKGNCNKKDK